MDITRLITIEDAINVLDYATDRVDFNTFTDSANSSQARVNLGDLLGAVIVSYYSHFPETEAANAILVKQNILSLPHKA